MIKLGIIGTGYISNIHTIAAKDLDNVSISSVFSRDRNNAKKFAEKYKIPNYYDNYNALLDSDVDAVIIGVPTTLHKDFSIKALKKFKHVLCEKPISLNISDAFEMQKAFQQSKKILMIAHVLRFWAEYVTVKKMMDDGALGNIRKIYAYRFASIPKWSKNNWLLNQDMSGGVPIDLQIHDVDYILWLLGEPKKYYSTGVSNVEGLIVNSSTVFQYNQATAVAEAGYVLAKGFRFEMGFKIITDSVVLDYSNLREPTLLIEKTGKPPEAIQFENYNAYRNQVSYFVECIKHNRQPEKIKLSDAIKSLQLSINIKLSILRNTD